MTSGTRLRERATAVLIRDGNVVLVRAPTLAGYLSFLRTPLLTALAYTSPRGRVMRRELQVTERESAPEKIREGCKCGGCHFWRNGHD